MRSANVILLALATVTALGLLAGRWIAANPEAVASRVRGLGERRWVAAARTRYRRQIAFLLRRFRPAGAYGLTLTIGLVGLVACIWVFGGVLEDVLAHEEIALFDAPIVRYVADHRTPWLTSAMESASALASWPFVLAVMAAGGLALRWLAKSWRGLWLLAFASGGAFLLDVLAKSLVARPRPPAAWMAVPAQGWAFPSGHATQIALYGALAHLIAGTLSTWRSKVRVWTLAAFVALAVGASRVYLGVHWPTDVLAGWALGGAWLALLLTASSTIASLRQGAELGQAPPAARSAAERLPPSMSSLLPWRGDYG
jgi:membrane-associated phospholipid phosphatase